MDDLAKTGKSSEKSENVRRAGLSTSHMLLILAGIIIICGTVIATILLLRSKQPAKQENPPGKVSVITEENLEAINREIDEKVANGMFETHMNTIWTFPDGSSPSNDAVMGNSASNNFTLYFTVSLTDTDEIVFTSGMIPVGSQIAEIVLENDLDEGTYPAVVKINMVDDDGEPIDSNMGINITLVILK